MISRKSSLTSGTPIIFLNYKKEDMHLPGRLSLIRGVLGLTRADLALQLKAIERVVIIWEDPRTKTVPAGVIIYQFLLQFGVNINFLLTGKGDMFLNSRTFTKYGVTFTKGDYVKLKSGSPTMTVIDFRSGEISCCWYDQFDEFKTKSFPVVTLDKVDLNFNS